MLMKGSGIAARKQRLHHQMPQQKRAQEEFIWQSVVRRAAAWHDLLWYNGSFTLW